MIDSFVEYVRDQLRDLRGAEFRRMFGGHGIYLSHTFFGIVHDDRVYFKTSLNTRAAYEACGMGAFRPSEKQTLVNYYEVPPEILDDATALVAWARQAIDVAQQADAVKTPKRKTKRNG